MKKNKEIIYWIVVLLSFLFGYIFLKTAYFSTVENSFVQEIVLVVLGTIITIAVTAALLVKQSEVELKKEQRVKIFDIKSSLYFELIDFIEKIIKNKEILPKDLLQLQFITYKISTIANINVLKSYKNFVEIFKQTSLDKKITILESNNLSNAFAELCIEIRSDLIEEDQLLENNRNIISDSIDSFKN